MDARFLQFYIQELAHVRDSGAEFAQRYPKIAARLGMHSTEVKDPYVERLLEGFAFLAARVQLRLNEEFPRFTEQLLNRISPNFLAPVPCMGVVQFNPDFNDAALNRRMRIKAGTVLQGQADRNAGAGGMATACRFSVAHGLTLLPLEIEQVSHGPVPGSPPRIKGMLEVRSALHIRIRNRGAQPLSGLPLDELDFHIACPDEYAFTLFDRILGQALSVGVRASSDSPWALLPASHLQSLGLEEADALLPPGQAQFSGSRLLQEFFAFPQRFLFFRVCKLKPHLSLVSTGHFELAIFFSDTHPVLDQVVDTGFLALNCTPVANLFEHSCDRLVLDPRSHELHLQASRVRSQDFEVHSLLEVRAHGQNQVENLPGLFSDSGPNQATSSTCYSIRRTPALVPEKQRREGGRSGYAGSEVYLSLTRPTGELAEAHGFHQLQVQALCTNRDLPLFMPIGQGNSDLTAPDPLPLKSIRFLRGPSRPGKPVPAGNACWQLVQHLSINYMGLNSSSESALHPGSHACLTQLLMLYADPAQPLQQQIAQAVRSMVSQPVTQRLIRQGRPVLVRGLHVQLQLDEEALQGLGMAILGGVLSRYLAAHVSVNSFVQTSVRSLQKGHVIEFPARCGSRPLL